MAGSQPLWQRDERLGILVSMVMLAVLLSAIIALPSTEFVLDLFGSELTLRFTGPVQILVLVAVLVCAGVDALVRQRWPRAVPGSTVNRPGALAERAPLPYRAAYYSLPTMLTAIGLVLVHSVQWWGYRIATTLFLGLLLTAVISMQLATHDLDTRARRTLRLALNALAYALALALFALIFGARLRSLLSATGILTASGLISLELYRNSETSAWRIWLYAGLTALLMGELTWALNYTAYSTQLASGVLLLAFYALTGLVQQLLWGRLTNRVVGEYVGVLVAGLVLLMALL